MTGRFVADREGRSKSLRIPYADSGPGSRAQKKQNQKGN
nr:MAG TPA: hypothetical protein [Caudoviricetes sp.]